MKKLIILILFVLQPFISCNNKKNNTIKVNNLDNEEIVTRQEEMEEITIRNVSENNDQDKEFHKDMYNKSISKLNFDGKKCIENFDAFFEKFSTDSIFQKKWILFPLKESYIGGDYYEDLIIEYTDSSVYKFKDFSKDKYAMDRKYDKYTAYIEYKDSIIEYKWDGYDNDIRMDFIFKLINNCWFMIAIENNGL